jgi:ABC-type sugar transport system substrate-binding protein
LVVASVGCSEAVEKPKPPAPVKILVITRLATADVTAGAKATAATLKDVTVEFSEAKTSAAQVAALKAAASAKNVQGVAIDCVAADEVSQAIAACVKAGIPVVTFNGDCPGCQRTGAEKPEVAATDCGRHSFVGEDPTLVGRLMAGELVQLLSAKGSGAGLVAIISAEGPDYKQMEDGVRSVLKDVNTFTFKEPVRVGETPAEVTKTVNDLLGTEQNLRGWIILNPAALPDKEATPLAKIGNAAVIVALAPNDTNIEFIPPDKVSTLFVPQYISMGSAVVQMLAGIARDQLQYADVIHLGPVVVTMGDIEATKKKFEKIKSGQAVAEIFAGGAGKPNQPTVGGPAAAPAAAPAAETKPAEETKPVAAPAAETKPVEAKSAEAPAAEMKPAETATAPVTATPPSDATK